MNGKMIVKIWDEGNQLRAKLALAPEDVEEALGRFGFMILNGAENVTPKHRTEIRICERFGAAVSDRSAVEVRAWIDARKVG